MTPQQKIKWAVVLKAVEMGKLDVSIPEGSRIACEYIDELYNELYDRDEHIDPENEIREGEIETGLPPECSRHYESKSVASKMPDGSWVGWTYWYGGGKHANPSEIDWISDAYYVNCDEEEKLVTIRKFSKIEGS